MDRLGAMAVTFIDVQLSHGAQAFQLFDSWAGTLSRPDYERFVLPHSRRVFAELAARHPAVPGIHFGIGCDHLLESMWAAGPRVIGLDWRTSISDARRRLGPDVVVQGNLDPALVLAGIEPATAAARRRARRQRRSSRPRLQPRPRRAARLGPGRAGGDRRAGPRRDRDVRTGVVLMAYGTPRAPEEIEAYYTDIRRGRPPTVEQLADLTRRYEAIGGTSPLAARTEAQRDALQRALDATPARPVRRADRAQARRSEDRGRRRRAGSRRSGAPRRSRAGPPLLHRCRSASTSGGPAQRPPRPGLPFAGIESWATEPAYVEFLADDVRRRLADMPANSQGRVHGPLPAAPDPRHRRPVSRRAQGDCDGGGRPSSASTRGPRGRSAGSRPGGRLNRGSVRTS